MRSALYLGQLVHVRTDEHARRFAYPCYVAAIDLDELPALDRELRLFSHDRINLFALADRDYGDGGELVSGVRAAFAAMDQAPASIELITQPRVCGYAFNPVSFFVGRDPRGAITAVIAEVNNTYGGRHRYQLGPAQRLPSTDGRIGFRTGKAFFVSPFIHGPVSYDWWLADRPIAAPRLDIRMELHRPDGQRIFVARLAGRRVPMTDLALALAALRYPLMTAQVIGLIHWQAVKLRLRGAIFRRPGPDHAPT